MKIGENTFVTLSYILKVAGKVEDRSPEGQPLRFPYGVGFLLPRFEENIAGLSRGDKFAFTLTPAQGYGELSPDAVVELPLDVFMVGGKIEDGLLEVGNHIPMSTQDGQSLMGVVKAVGANSATLDFNHPMAGKTLDFSGEIEDVRATTAEDLAPLTGGGCGCNCGGCHDCNDHDCHGCS
ncbi:MAG: peptidylprolyl isomerase [Rikenellaceae bacterium]|jgi:FKBP-type peptidyl-prolyl cis-trans isomerase SlyD|nr:peptidylprolyl isomerase [Rikenellaceae bacterium]